MKPGLYEKLLNLADTAQLQHLHHTLTPEHRPIDPSELPTTTARYLLTILTRALTSRRDGTDPATIVNAILTELLRHTHPSVIDEGDFLGPELRELLSILPVNPITNVTPIRPAIPLNSAALLVNAAGEPSIGSEICKELASADRVDLLCSFLKWSGYRIVQPVLQALTQRGAKLRVLTTCYLGATDVKVVDALSELGEVKISYNSKRTRLHAKAWLFHRDTGYSTAYIGSSNLSSAALLDGLEWNVRLSQTENANLLDKFQATYDAYWHDSEFQSYVPERDRNRFLAAINREVSSSQTVVNYSLNVQPYNYQQEILEKLDTERLVHGRWKNLVVAATGCGKTVIAALDYKRFLRRERQATLLFVAHRDEILTQSLHTFRAVLQDAQFGDKWTGRETPQQDQHLFASVQKLSNLYLDLDLDQFSPERFDVIVVDEFHHSEAPTYRRLLNYFRPKVLLGLTATPERTDGQSVLDWFDGKIAAELRVWDAIERGFLSPFQYFGLHDNVDISTVRWTRGYDIGQLDRLYTGDDARARLIWNQVCRLVTDPARMRALAFCVGVQHAVFMANFFLAAGVAATAVLGTTPPEERKQAIARLGSGELQVICTVDVFNEGVDIPEVDTVLLLRPTESATVFLQQIGRGLRLADDKDCLTILDFIGQANSQFRFDLLYRGLVGGTRRDLVDQVEQGFPFLPSGCAIQLDRVAQKIILDNLRQQLKLSRKQLIQELRAVGPHASLAEFLERSGQELSDIYGRSEPGWMSLRRAAGFEPSQPTDDEPPLVRAVSRMLHIDSSDRLEFYHQYLTAQGPAAPTDERERRLLQMLRFSLWSGNDAVAHSPADLWNVAAVREELRELLPVLSDKVDHLEYRVDVHPDVPLAAHCHYSLSEILAAFGVLNDQRPHQLREGVYYHEPSACDLFFITINKSERDYSPSTMYKDYAISPTLFHWQSQNSTRENSPTGLRYQSHRLGGTHALLFVRERKKDANGGTSPYLYLGPAGYVSHEGERPMGIVWELRWAIPMVFYRAMRVAA